MDGVKILCSGFNKDEKTKIEQLMTAMGDLLQTNMSMDHSKCFEVHTIASNAVIVGKLLEQDNTDVGYDAAKGEYVDMMKAGIIDPLKVIRTTLLDAASVSSLMTTTEYVIVEIPKLLGVDLLRPQWC